MTRLFALIASLVLLVLAGCETPDDLSHNVGFRAGFVGTGIAAEATGPEGNGIGISISLYPVMNGTSKLTRTW